MNPSNAVLRRVRRDGYALDVTMPRNGWGPAERRLFRFLERKMDGENLWRRLFG